MVAHGFTLTLASIQAHGVEPQPSELDQRIMIAKLNYQAGSGTRALLSRLQAAWKLRRLLAANSPQIIYLLDSPALPFYWVATNGFRSPAGTRVIYHTFEWLDPTIAAPWQRRLERKIARKADLVVNADRSRARLMQSIYRLEKTPLDLPVFLPASTAFPARNEARRRQTLGPDATSEAILIVCPSVASADRLTLELIEAIAVLPNRYHLFTIIENNSYGQACTKRVGDYGLRKRVTFSPPLPYEELLEIVASADIGVIFHDPRGSAGNFMCHPSRLSMFVGLGIPFVGTDVPNLAASVYRYQLGECCDPFQPESVAAAIRRLAEEAPGLAARRQHIRRVFETELCFEKHFVRLARELDRQCQSNRND